MKPANSENNFTFFWFLLHIVTVLLNNSSNTAFKEIADHNVNTLMELVNDLQSERIAKLS